jgi:hypothetical protein
MIDPISIGLAFTAAQTAVSHIKQAIALGKDVNSLVGQFSKFFESADAVHRAKILNKAKSAGKSDYELGREALEIAMHSDALREAERQLKDMIVWQLGKPQIWEQMIKERTRLFKERAEAEAKLAELDRKRKQKIADQFMFAMYFIGVSIFLFAFIMGGIGIYGAVEDKRIYEEKVAKAQLERNRRAKAEQERSKQEALDAVK